MSSKLDFQLSVIYEVLIRAESVEFLNARVQVSASKLFLGAHQPRTRMEMG